MIERIFGTVRAEDCTEEFTFGHEGKPLLIRGPNDSLGSLQQRQIGFTIATALDEPPATAEPGGVAEPA